MPDVYLEISFTIYSSCSVFILLLNSFEYHIISSFVFYMYLIEYPGLNGAEENLDDGAHRSMVVDGTASS